MVCTKKELEKQKQERLGEEKYNLHGTLMKIIKYNNTKDIIVEFQDKYKVKVHTQYGNFKKGEVRNPYDKTIHEVGYIGEGEYETHMGRIATIAYKVWISMLQRCYDPYYLDKYPTYRDCMVCNDWHNFQNFAEWFYKNYYEVPNDLVCLDKDILIKGNKIYSPETCIFVPKRINALFTKRQNDRGDYPIGVCWHKRDKKFDVGCNDVNCNRQYLGRFDNEIDAFICYKNYKEKVIKQVADEYKELIPKELYEALYKYEVEISD